MKITLKYILLFLIIVATNANSLKLKVLTESDIENYMATDYNKSEMAFKTMVLGVHNGANVIVEHPCSDMCPNHTVRVVRYDVSLTKCNSVKGNIVKHTIPYGIGTKRIDYCVPNINLNNVINKKYGANKNT